MKRARTLLASFLISPRTSRVSRYWHESRRRLGRRPHTVVFYHRVADAWSWLLAQSLPRLLQDYDVEIKIKLLSALPIDCVPDPQRLDRYASYDAMRLARAWGLSFPDGAQIPTESLTHLAERIILGQPDDALDVLVRVNAAVWAADSSALFAMANEYGTVDEMDATTLLSAHAKDLRRRGHYQSGMLWFQGEWFWGLDRLNFLEQRLRARKLNRGKDSVSEKMFRPLERNTAGAALPMDLEFYFSFRSPYSYLAAARVAQLADRLGLNLVLRPLLPMVARGLSVAPRKLRYIIKDAARIARQEKLPFGPVRDPLGKGVERCLAVLQLANSKGVGREFMLAAMRAIWTEAADLTHDGILQRVAGSVGLAAADVEQVVGSGTWRAQVEGNAAALAVLGMWGVPGLCLRGADDKPVSVAWGQDRLWVIERAALGVDVAMPPPSLVR